jgi:hypothetical protein
VIQDFRRKYSYNHKHDATSLAYLLNELAAADTIRVLTEAPKLTTESANAVADSVLLLTQMMQASQDYDESAFVVQSDSDSSNGGRKGHNRRSGGGNRNRNSRSKSRDSHSGLLTRIAHNAPSTSAAGSIPMCPMTGASGTRSAMKST